jgi:cell division protein FtsQ
VRDGGPDAPIKVFSTGPRARLTMAPAALGSALRRLGPGRLAILVVLALAAGGGWLWFRDSSVVTVSRVTVTGLEGPGAGRIRSALIAAARGMTTLDVQVSRLHTAVQPFPDVRALKVTTEFPHGLRIHVIEQTPAAVLSAAGHRLAVSADGTVLRDVRPSRGLPAIAVRALPAGTRLAPGSPRAELSVLAAAPRPLRSRIVLVGDGPLHGIVVHLRRGPSLYFGTAGQLREKWIAAAAVLANERSAGAAYIDLSDPQRPAAG